MQIVVQKNTVKPFCSFVTLLKRESNGQPDVARARHPVCNEKQLMKRCAQCHRKLGLGVHFRNKWNGHWWVHVRFCSVRCEAIYEVKRNDAVKTSLAPFPRSRQFAKLTKLSDAL